MPVGRHGLLVEVESSWIAESLYAEIRRHQRLGIFPEVADIVPAARTVLLDGAPDSPALARWLAAWRPGPQSPHEDQPVVAIPTRYDGPDLGVVADQCAVSERDIIAMHTTTTFRVAFCGFMPGFAYLAGLPPTVAVSRRHTPRVEVPAGAVGLAGEFSGVYPRPSPGGWQIIGHTDIRLWNPSRRPPALLAPGTRVQFSEVHL